MKKEIKKFAENTKIPQDLAEKVLNIIYKSNLDAKCINEVIYRMEKKILDEKLVDMLAKMSTGDIQAIVDQVLIELDYWDDVPEEAKEANEFHARTFFQFNEEGRTYIAGDMVQIQIMRVGKWNHPEYGTFEITDQMMKEFKSNFDKMERGIELAVDENHESNHRALGWFKELYIENDGLFAKIKLNRKGAELLTDGAYKYFSPEFIFTKVDEESGKVFKNLLVGGAFTNRPFFKKMEPLFASEVSPKQTDKESDQSSYISLITNKGNKAMNEFMRLVGELKNLKELNDEQKTDVVNAFNDLPTELKKTEEYTQMYEEVTGEKPVVEEEKADEDKPEDEKVEEKEDEADKKEEKEEKEEEEEEDESEEEEPEAPEVKATEGVEKNGMVSIKLSELHSMQKFINQAKTKSIKTSIKSELEKDICLSESNKSGLKFADIDAVVDFATELSKEQRGKFFSILENTKALTTAELGHAEEVEAKEYDTDVKDMAMKVLGMNEEDAEKAAKHFREEEKKAEK